MTAEPDNYTTTMDALVLWNSSDMNFYDVDDNLYLDSGRQPSSPMSPDSHAAGFANGQYDGMDTSSTSTPDINSSNSLPLSVEAANNREARRRAQNRAAQRAYRARKEKDIQSGRARILELEQQLEQLSKRGGEAKQLSILTRKNQTLEKENKSLNLQVQQVRWELRCLLNNLSGLAGNVKVANG